MKPTFYHTSGTKFKVGDILGGPGKRVFLHTSPVPHGTIQDIVESGYGSWIEFQTASDKDFKIYWEAYKVWDKTKEGEQPVKKPTKNPKPVDLTVYEMKPFNKAVFGNCWDEYIVIDDFVEVVKIVGNAKGILDNFKKKFGETSKAHFFNVARKPNHKVKKQRNKKVIL